MIAPTFLFNSECVLLVSSGSNTKGNVSWSYSGVSGLGCAYMVDSESEAALYGRNSEMNSFTVWLPYDTVVKKTDIVVVGGLSGDVVSLDDVQGRGVYLWVKCVEAE